MMSLWVFKVLCYLKRHKILIGGLILIILAIVGVSIYNSHQVEKPVCVIKTGASKRSCKIS